MTNLNKKKKLNRGKCPCSIKIKIRFCLKINIWFIKKHKIKIFSRIIITINNKNKQK